MNTSVEIYTALEEIPNTNAIEKRADYFQYIDEFLNAQDVKQNSKTTYRKALKQFFLWTMENIHTQPTRQDILNFKNYLIDGRKVSPTTATNYLVAVRKFFEWGESEKLYPNIAKNIKGAKRPSGFRKGTLTVSQVKELICSIDQTSLEGLRDYALINLLVRTGLRTIEIQRAFISDLQQEGGEAVLYIQGKGRDEKDAFVMLTPSTLKPIRQYLSARGELSENEALFASLSNKNKGEAISTRSIRRIVKERLEGIDIIDKRLSAHSLRHTAVTLSLMGGATLQEAQTLARHSNINTTLIYAQNMNRIKQAPERKIDKMLN